MLENDRMETSSAEVASIRRRNDIEKSTWRTHRYFVNFESRIPVEIFTPNRCHHFHVDLSFTIDVISTTFPRGISTSNRWQIDEMCPFGNQTQKDATIHHSCVYSFIDTIVWIYWQVLFAFRNM